ncbi:hypothetical protein ACHQM5_014148 [Ranunculus cassubicifolius]
MGRSPCCAKVGLNRGAWTSHEDKILTDYIQLNGQGGWRELPKKAGEVVLIRIFFYSNITFYIPVVFSGLKRCGKSCRLRWLNYLRPDIKRGNITPDEEDLIIKLHKLLGNRWSLIAGRIPGRTDNEIKNYWNTNLVKRVKGCSRPTSVQTKSSKTQQMTESSNEAETSPKVQVIRTKAYKCTKAFLTPQPTNIDQHNFIPSDDDNGVGFFMDLDTVDFGLSDLLGSDFPQFNSAEERGNIKNSTCNALSDTVVFNGGSLDDLREGEHSSDLHSLSFLDPEESWFHE